MTIKVNEKENNRIVMIDALRGFALAGIFLLHHIQHFNFFVKPEFSPDWLMPIDLWLKDTMYFFIAGKAFALFSLLFGFSYWLIYENGVKRGEQYLFRHFWRMTLLIGFGLFHLMFFAGDILIMYAVLGLPLVLTRYMSSKMILLTAIVLIINPISVYTIGSYFFTDTIYNSHLAYPVSNLKPLLMENSFWQLLQGHFEFSYFSSVIWSWNVGRIMAISGLFFLGVYLAKSKSMTERPLQFWYYLLLFSLGSWLCLDLLNDAGLKAIEDKSARKLLWQITQRYMKISMLLSILSSFILVWRHNQGSVFVAKFINFGRMGLSNYLLMSITGTFIYYGWGLALYKYCGTSISLFIGITLLMLQMKLSTYWLRRYGQGPLEKLWRKLTWIPIKKNTAIAQN
ncbi:DUF418 domain-containing protein [Colwellia piezophila]|uniref:DUF418 domain-containing protein n=1 Tax=Colwellia piezophila TaxID=211668 RepID=UPI0003813021|nr:DUF418 domain-containing protein [Colwellia piezophila]